MTRFNSAVTIGGRIRSIIVFSLLTVSRLNLEMTVTGTSQQCQGQKRSDAEMFNYRTLFSWQMPSNPGAIQSACQLARGGNWQGNEYIGLFWHFLRRDDGASHMPLTYA